MMGGKGSGAKGNDKDAATVRQLRDAIQRQEGKAIEASKRKAKAAFADAKKRKEGK